MTRSAVGSGAGARPEQSQAERRAGGAGRLRGRSGPRAPSALRPCRAVLRGPHAFRGFPPSSGLSEPFSGRATRRWDGISPGRCVVDSLAFPRRTFLRGGREVLQKCVVEQLLSVSVAAIGAKTQDFVIRLHKK
ncbi:Mitochondrial Import Inner Membrane Translocase Subunit Tim50 [Manis pentadactyla]|nr:Mitochondrial Import Inner Membrane Translocase Subunit Tim50 [Manis pentadactyla]